ncbi:MAG: LEA type 2 family protein [Candidatus Altiarchaeota archaeon]|nr:LEA type 2 family protein [Candidatus Altiarchaeota archaeon]
MKAGYVILSLIVLTALTAAGVFYVWQGVSKTPEVKVVGVDYRVEDSITVLGVEIPMNVTIIAELEAYNPNIIPIKVVGADYTVYVNDNRVGSGALKEPVEIPADGRKAFKTEVGLDTASALQNVLSVLKTGAVRARVSGKAYVELPLLGVKEIPIEGEEKITLA